MKKIFYLTIIAFFLQSCCEIGLLCCLDDDKYALYLPLGTSGPVYCPIEKNRKEDRIKVGSIEYFKDKDYCSEAEAEAAKKNCTQCMNP